MPRKSVPRQKKQKPDNPEKSAVNNRNPKASRSRKDNPQSPSQQKGAVDSRPLGR
jgi:hypothetical protein